MMKMNLMALSVLLLCENMQAAQDGNDSPVNITHRFSDDNILLSKDEKNGNSLQKTKNNQDQIIALQQSIDEQALHNKVLALSAQYNKLIKDPKNNRDVVTMIKGNIVQVNPTQDTLKEMNDTAQLLEVVKLYNRSLQHQYRDEYSVGARDKDNQELQYLLDLRNFMKKSNTLPDKNDQAYQAEMKFLVQQCRYSITINNMFNDTLSAVEDRIVVLMKSRARDSERAAARKNVVVKQAETTSQPVTPAAAMQSENSVQVSESSQILAAPVQKNNKINANNALYGFGGIGKNQMIAINQLILPANLSLKPSAFDNFHYVDTDHSDESSIEELD